MEQQPPPEILAAMARQVIALGIATCEQCELPITDPDDDIIMSYCGNCGEVELWHDGCLPDNLRREAQQDLARQNWRWN